MAFISIYKEKYRNLSLKNKLTLSYICISMLPLISISICALYLLYNFCTQRAISDYEESLNQMADNLDYKIGLYNTSMDYLINNSNLAHALQDTHTNSWTRYTNYIHIIDPTLSAISNLNTDFQSITIYHDNSLLDCHRPGVMTMDYFEKPSCFEQILNYEKIWTVENGCPVFYSRLINTKLNAPLTIVRTAINESSVFDLYFDNLPEYRLVLSDKSGNVLWDDSSLQGSRIPENAASCTHLCRALQNVDWSLELYLPVSYIYVYISSLLRTIFIVILICLAIILPLSALYSKNIVNRLTYISKKMNEIEHGNLSVLIESPARDEIGQLASHFNTMTLSLNSTMEKLYQAEIDRQKAENQALRAQINPHFLYNTLSMINWLSIKSGNMEISSLITTLSKFYRTALNHGNIESLLSDELLNVQSYLHLQLKMHSDSFSTLYQIPEECKSCIVPTFILQPIAENAIEHGIDTIRNLAGKILIEATESENFLYLTISNNGTPFEEAAFYNALNQTEKSYGLKNVYARILALGEGCYMKLATPPSGYTTSIQIRLLVKRADPGPTL